MRVKELRDDGDQQDGHEQDTAAEPDAGIEHESKGATQK
jgi:hypothetical protein